MSFFLIIYTKYITAVDKNKSGKKGPVISKIGILKTKNSKIFNIPKLYFNIAIFIYDVCINNLTCEIIYNL